MCSLLYQESIKRDERKSKPITKAQCGEDMDPTE